MAKVRKSYMWFIALVLVAVLVLAAWYLHSGTSRGLTAKTAIAVVRSDDVAYEVASAPNLVIFFWTATTSLILKLLLPPTCPSCIEHRMNTVMWFTALILSATPCLSL